MQIIIDIPESTYKYLADLVDAGGEPLGYFERVIMRGTPLQKGHGDLIDRDKLLNILEKLKWIRVNCSIDEDNTNILEDIIVEIPSVLKADTDKEIKNADSN